MFTIEDFLRISNQMRDYYAKKIKDSRVYHLQITDACKPILKIIDEEIGKINKTLFYDVSAEEMKNLKQTMNKLQKRVEEGKQLSRI